MAPKISVQNKPGVKLLRGMWHPVVNVWREGRIIASEVMTDKYPDRAAAQRAAKAHCDKVDAIVRAALTPVTVVQSVKGEGDGNDEAQTV